MQLFTSTLYGSWWSHGQHELCFCVFSSVSSSKSIIPLNSLFLHVPKILLSIHNHKYLLFFHQAFTFSYYHLQWVKSCWLCFWIHCVPHLWTFVVILVIFCCYLGIACSFKFCFSFDETLLCDLCFLDVI